VEASILQVTAIIRANVVISAVERDSRGATAVGTLVTDGAGVSVVANKPIVHRF